MSDRQISLDLMRFLGVFIIIIAHANPPGWLFQLRNFGTPLLIVASALTYSLIYSKKDIKCLPFLLRRLERLIFPVWLFLTFFFLFFWCYSFFSGEEYQFSLYDIVFSYTFYSGIGYVWIFKVYIFLAIVTPISLKIRDVNMSRGFYFTFLLLLYFSYELSILFVRPMVSVEYEIFFDNVVFALVPYFILYLYGMRLAELSNRELSCVIMVSLFIFVFLAFFKYFESGQVVSTQDFKYPPTMYYLSYAFFALNTVYLFCKNLPDIRKGSGVIVWLASRTLWIYLWHIMALYLWDYNFESQQGILWFAFKFIFVIFFSFFVTFVQELVVLHYFSKDTYLGRKIILLLT